MTLITVQQPIFILSKTCSNLDKNNIIFTIKKLIKEFWDKEPFTRYLYQHGKPTRLATEWYPINNLEAIPVLKKIGCEVDTERMRVRKTLIPKKIWTIQSL